MSGPAPSIASTHVLDRHVLVLQPLRFLLGGVEQLPERAGDAELTAARRPGR